MVVGLILFFVLLMSGQRMLAASNLYKNANSFYNQTANMSAGAEKEANLSQVAAMAAEAGRTDPYNANYPALLAETSALQYQLMIQQKNPSSSDELQIIKAAIQTAEKLSPDDIEVRNTLINTCILSQDIPGAIQQTNLALETNPLDANIYSEIIKIATAAADNSLKQKDNKAAVEYLQAAIRYAAKMESQKAKIDPQKMQAPFWVGAPFVLNQEAQFDLGKAYYLLGDYPHAQKVLQPLIDVQMNSEQIKAWCLAAMYKNGATVETQAEIQTWRTSDSQGAATFDSLVQMTPLTSPQLICTASPGA
jgi:tetratricopeptide (TPR) repeat protein